MKYRLLLGGVRINGVIDVKESVEREISQYISVNGRAFCEDKGAALKLWLVEAELDFYDKRNVERQLSTIKDMASDGEVVLLSVSSDIRSFSSRVVIKKMQCEFISSEACRLRLELLEYVKPVLSVTACSRPGNMPDPPSQTTAGSVYKITTQFSRTGTEIVVKNPLTGVDISNIAAIDRDTLVKIEKTT